ncbi:hypothetical protein A0U40_10835 [[Bacillus] sp. KCTC 13219]|nr:hypothetical protein A0U40_10835 [[Bacillus] sp. KCTC 13219]
MIELLNIGSLLLGLAAWLLPFGVLLRPQTNPAIWIIFSFVACAIAIAFQIFYTQHVVQVEDWAALMDTMDAVAFATKALLIVTIVLNICVWLVQRRRIIA